MISKIVIRKAEKSDINALAELASNYQHHYQKNSDKNVTGDFIYSQSLIENNLFLLAFIDKTPVGYLLGRKELAGLI